MESSTRTAFAEQPRLYPCASLYLPASQLLQRRPNVATMSSMSSAKISSQTDRRPLNDDLKSSRGKLELQEGRQTLANGAPHRRMPSSTQRSRTLDERRTDRVKVTTRDSLAARTRSPHRRAGSLGIVPERPKPVENKGTEQRPRSRTDSLQGEQSLILTTSKPDISL